MPAVIYSRTGSEITGYTTAETNLIANPSFEVNLNGWANGGTSFTRITTDAYAGTACGQLVTASITQAAFGTQTGLTASLTYTGSVWVKGEAGKLARLDFRESTAASATVGTDTTGPDVTMTGAWQRLSVSRTFGATGVTGTLIVRNRSSAAHTILIDAAMLQTGATATTYFDGSTTDALEPPGPNARQYGWSGAANASSSIAQKPTYAGTYGTVPVFDPILTSTSESRNRVHRILNLAAPEMSYAPAGLRTGELELFYGTSEADASTAEQMFRDGTTFQIAYPERPEWEMTFALSEGGRIVRSLDRNSRNHWTVVVDYQELPAEAY